MKALISLAFAVALLAAWPAAAQQQGRGVQMQKQGMQPGERGRDERREFRRERIERKDGERRHFSREERDKLRQDLLDANQEMKGKR